jgi:hypothetical protein
VWSSGKLAAQPSILLAGAVQIGLQPVGASGRRVQVFADRAGLHGGRGGLGGRLLLFQVGGPRGFAVCGGLVGSGGCCSGGSLGLLGRAASLGSGGFETRDLACGLGPDGGDTGGDAGGGQLGVQRRADRGTEGGEPIQ